jgi:hypothetical protein
MAGTTDHMMTEEEITERLEKLGQKPGDIRATMRAAAELIVARTAAAYIASLPEEDRAKLMSLPEEEAEIYLAERRDSLPQMPQEEFEKIHDKTWEDYFASAG